MGGSIVAKSQIILILCWKLLMTVLSSSILRVRCSFVLVCRQVVVKEKPVTGFVEQKDPDKSLLVTANPVFDRNDRVAWVVCNLRDLDELYSLKREIECLSFSEKPVPEPEWELYRNELASVVSRSAAMRRVLSSALRVAQVDSTVLILGESGVGKDMIARLIHKVSKRRDRPFVKISCGAIPEHLLESELFGYEGGAFTGAKREGKPGLFELAEDGTVFLDEVGELPLSLQVKLLNVLQDRTFMRVGGLKPIPAKARVIAATNKDLENLVKEGRFREDLFYRLHVIPIEIPPLRARRGDILPLIQHFLKSFNERYGFQRTLTPAALDFLMKYDWPGNVRELQNVIEFLVVMSQGEVIDVGDLPPKIVGSVRGIVQKPKDSGRLSLREAVEEYERELITRALREHGTLREAAESLGIDLSTLTRKKQKYGLIKNKEG